METVITHNQKNERFETIVKGDIAYVEYRWEGDILVIMHTFVPPSARGLGIADQLAHHILEFVKSQHIKTKVYCPFVKAYLERHPEYKELTIPT